MMNRINETVRRSVKERGLINKGDRILIGLSGGADSVCLTHVLSSLKNELGITVMTAHVNHMIRGGAADSDAAFASEYSKSLGIECVTAKIDVPSLAERKGISEETAGREARYSFFSETLERFGLNKIATAHNLNDNAETIVMNFMRGGSLKGLSGIPAARGRIIRPLIGISRGQIEEYCRENGLHFVTDSTNADNTYTRNKVRNILIPLIEREFNPDFVSAVTRNAELIRADDDYIGGEARSAYDRLVTNSSAATDALLSCGASTARRVVRMMIGEVPSDFVMKVIKLAEANKSGTSVSLPGGKSARIEYGRLIIDKTSDNKPFEYRLPLGRDVTIAEAGIVIRADAADERKNDGAQYFSGTDTDNLTVRSRKNGDCFYPAGMLGAKKLKDYFIDEKIPRRERETTPVLLSGDDIVWIVGRRRDRRFAFKGSGVRITVKHI